MAGAPDAHTAGTAPDAARPAAHRPPIGGRRLLASPRSVALLRLDAVIDWWCVPDFDSPPLLWELLDPTGGRAAFDGLWYAAAPGQQRTADGAHQPPAGPRMITVLGSRAGRVRVVDELRPATTGEAVVLVRTVTGLDGDLDVTHRLSVGGMTSTRGAWTVRDGVAVATCQPEGSDSADQGAGLTVRVLGGSNAVEGHDLRTRLLAPRSQPAVVQIVAGEGLAAGAEVGESAVDLVPGRRWLPRSHPERALDAVAVMRACTYAPTGAVVASPTTSLPEIPGDRRQYDYRFCWLRDASLALSVASLLGQTEDAAAYLDFVHGISAGVPRPDTPVVTIRGGPLPSERTVMGEGWDASRPVRVGNEASGQTQYDALGMLVEAVSVHIQTGGRLQDRTWAMVRQIADEVAGGDVEQPPQSHGIWELREPRPLVDGDIGRWLLLDRAVWIARMRHPWSPTRRWIRSRDTIGQRVVAAIDPRTGLLPQSYGQDPPTPDASALMAVVFGLLDGRQRTGRRLVDATIEALDAYPYLYRFPPDIGGSMDPSSDGGGAGAGGAAAGAAVGAAVGPAVGVGAGAAVGPGAGAAASAAAGGRGRRTEGAFLPMSAMAITALAKTGQVARAERRLDDLCAALPRLIAEEVDPVAGEPLGNVPLVWSHMELARALYVLDAERRRARWTGAGLWAWRIGRYLRMR